MYGDLPANDDAPPAEARPAQAPPGSEVPAAAGAGAPRVELAGIASYVTAPIRGGANPFGAGFGARAGLEFSGFYVGVSVLDFLGGRDVDVSYAALLYGLEVGWGFRLAAFSGAWWTLRPHVTVGDAAVSYTDPTLAADVVTSASGGSRSDTLTVNNVFVEPGLTLELSGGAVLAAVDGSVLTLPGIAYGGAASTTWICYSGQLHVGFRF